MKSISDYNGLKTVHKEGERTSVVRSQIDLKKKVYLVSDATLWTSKITRIVAIIMMIVVPFWFLFAGIFAFGNFQNSGYVIMAAAESTPEVLYEYYEGSWTSLPNFDALQPVEMGVVDDFTLASRNRNDYFGFRFLSCLSVDATGVYTFYTKSDDGSKAYINGIGVVNNDGLHGVVEKSGTITLTAGYHPIEITFFERSGGESLQVLYEGPGIAKQKIPGSRLSTDCMPPLEISLPDTTIYRTNLIDVTVAARNTDGTHNTTYTGTVHITSTDDFATLPADYTFTTGTGLDNGSHTFGLVFNTPGQHVITVTDTISPSLVATSTIVVNDGVLYEYYEGGWSNLPNFDEQQAVETGVVGNFTIAPRNRNDYFGFRFQGCLSVDEAGVYTFYTQSDDGSKLFINGAEIVNNDGIHGVVEKSGSAALSPGSHSIEVTFFEYSGGESLGVLYAGPGIVKQTIPNSLLSTACLSGYSPLAASLSNSIVDLTEPVDMTVLARNSDGTPNTSYTGTVEFISTDNLATLPVSYTFASGTGLDNGSHTFADGLIFNTPGQHIITVTDTVFPSLVATSTVIVRNSGPAVSLYATISPTTAFAGDEVLQLIVEARDAEGRRASSYRGSIEFVESATSTLPDVHGSLHNTPDYTFTEEDAGRATFTFAFQNSGTQNVYIYDWSDSNLNVTSNNVTVEEVFLSATISPTTAMVGESVLTLVVEAQDANGDVWPGYRGSIEFVESAASTLPDVHGSLSNTPDYTFTENDAGRATFTFAFKTSGVHNVYIYDWADSANRNTTSNDVTVEEVFLTATISPTAAVAGEAVLTLTVEAQDANGDVWPDYRGSIEFVESAASTLPDIHGSLSNQPDYTFTESDAGRATFTFAFNSGGTHNVYIYDWADSANRNTTSNDVEIAEVYLTAVISPTTGIAKDRAFTLTVEARDQNGNIWPYYRGDIEFVESASSTLPDIKPPIGNSPDYTFTAADAGRVTFNFAFNEIGTQNVYIYDHANTNRNVTSNDVEVIAPPAPTPPPPVALPMPYIPPIDLEPPSSIPYHFGLPLMAVSELPSNSWQGYPEYPVPAAEGAIYLTAGLSYRTPNDYSWATFYTVDYLGWENPLTDQRDSGGGTDGGPAANDDFAFAFDVAGTTWPISHDLSTMSFHFAAIAPANTEGVHLDVHAGGNAFTSPFIIGANAGFDFLPACGGDSVAVGDPVDTRSGTFYLVEQDFGVATGCQGMDLGFQRVYRSQSLLVDSPFGYGWTHNYNTAVISLTQEYVAVRRPFGEHLIFKDVGSDVYASIPGLAQMLVKRPGGGWALVNQNRYVELFDAEGKLIAQQDANGNMVWLTYETATREGETVTRLARVDAPGGRYLWFGYDYYDIDLLTQVADHTGRTTYYGYDMFGFLDVVTDTLGAATTYTYDNFLLTSQTDPLDNVVFTNQYDDGGRVITQTNSLGQFLTLDYAVTGEAITTTVTEHNTGAATVYVYGVSDGQLRQVTDPLGATTQYRSYTDTRRPTEIEDALGHVTQVEYNDRGWPTVVTNTLDYSTQIAYDNWGNSLFITDTLGHDTQFIYDGPNLVQVIDPAGQTVQFVYSDQAGWQDKLTAIVNQAGVTTTLAYNSAGDAVEITNVLGGITHIAYDSLGRPVGVADSRNYTTTLAFDDADQVTQIADPLGGTIDFDYLPTGQISTTQIAGLLPITYTYGSNGLPETAQQGNRIWHYNYDALGNLVSITDPLSHTVNVDYELATRPVTQTLPANRLSSFGYDAVGNLTSLTPPGRDAHTFSYSPLNMLSAYTPPLIEAAGTISYTYNPAGQLTQVIRPDDTTVDLDYDVSGRLETVVILRGAYELDYDSSTGTLAGIAAPGGITLTYAYTGLLPTGQTWQGPITGSVGITYDPDFRLASESVNGDGVNFSYDAAGRLVQAGDLALTRNPQNGLIINSNLNAITETWQYNGYGEPTDYLAAYYETALHEANYARDDAGRIITKTETVDGNVLTTGYTYDDAGRLAAVIENGVVVAQYSYDLNGNRLAYTDTLGTVITATYDAQDRLLQYGANVYDYAATGELQTKIDTSANLTTTYSYDAFGNLTAATLPDGTQIDYLIDGQNRRIGKMVDSVLVQGFLYKDQLNPVAELDGSGQVVARFVYGSKMHVPDYMVKNGVTYRILTDHLGSPRLVVNVGTGQVVQEMAYDAFGNIITDTNPGFQPFGFAGGLYDQHTKLTRFGARDYDAEVGRWTTKDPLNFSGGDTNLYAYVFNDPVNLIDPTGEIFWWIVGGGLIGAGFNLGSQLAKNGGDWSQVDWLSVGLSGASGMLGTGLGFATTSIFWNVAGSAVIGGGMTLAGNFLRGECDLSKNVLEAAILNGVFSGAATAFGAVFSKAGSTVMSRIDEIKYWKIPTDFRIMGASMANSMRYIKTFEPSWRPVVTGFANAFSITLSNSSSYSYSFLDKINYFRPPEPGCACN